MLRKELSIFTFRDLLEHFPLRYVDKTQVSNISDINYQTEYIQVAGKISGIRTLGENRAKRLVADLTDASGEMELTWFQGINWVQKILKEGGHYLVYGKAGFFNGNPQITHPEIELIEASSTPGKSFLEPVYPTTEKLKAKGLNARQLGKLTEALILQISEKDVPENLPSSIVKKLHLISRFEAFRNIHFPRSNHEFQQAIYRLKFEELFIAQVRLHLVKIEPPAT